MVGLLRLTLLRFLATDRLGLKRARLRKQSLLPVLLAEIRNENKNPPGATKTAGESGRRLGLSQGKQGLVKVVDLRGHVVVHHHDLVGVHDFIGVQASQAHHTLEGVGQGKMSQTAA